MSSVRRTFASLGVPSHFSGRLAKSGIVWPTAVQRAALDALLPRTASQPATPARSALLRWPTGSGKTLAYALPMLSRLSKNATGVQAVVCTPTRELCLQTLKILQLLTSHGRPNKKGHAIKVMSAMGQVHDRMLLELLHQPPAILIGTPQPLGLLMRAGALPLTTDLSRRILVLDEVDSLAAHFRWPHIAHLLASSAGRKTEKQKHASCLSLPKCRAPTFATCPRCDSQCV